MRTNLIFWTLIAGALLGLVYLSGYDDGLDKAVAMTDLKHKKELCETHKFEHFWFCHTVQKDSE